MTQNEIRNEELSRHEEKVDRNLERHQKINLQEKQRGIAVANQNSSIARIVNITYFAVGIIESLLFVRILLHMLNANLANGFVSFIYGLSYPFVAFFANLVQNPPFGTGVLEITTLIAMLVWGIVGWLLGRLIWLVLSRPR